MRKLLVTVFTAGALLLVGTLTFQADAQITRGAAVMPTQAQNFTPIEKAACGPFRGPHCGPFHHWVCRGWHHQRCWCAHC
jgi:hypothetical protein